MPKQAVKSVKVVTEGQPVEKSDASSLADKTKPVDKKGKTSKASAFDVWLVANPKEAAWMREACKKKAARGGCPVPHDWHGELRAMSRIFEGLLHDGPELKAYLKARGIDPAKLPKDYIQASAETYLKIAENKEYMEFPRCLRHPQTPPEADKSFPGLNTARVSEVEEEAVAWLWENLIPLGKLTLISGDPGIGKTWVVLDFIARLTTRRPMPDGTYPFRYTTPGIPPRYEQYPGDGHYQPGDGGYPQGFTFQALFVSAEDAIADTIKPRLRMLEADDSRVHFLKHVNHDKKEQELNLKEHVRHLDKWLSDNPMVRVVVLDPLAAFLGNIDSHKNADVRSLLTPLAKMAEKRQVAIIGICHLNKGEGGNALNRINGSVGFGAAVRSSLQVTVDPNQPNERRFLTRAKGSVATDIAGALAFRVGPNANGISWEKDRVEMSANEALNATPDKSRAPARNEAKDWLLDLLKDGPMPAKEVLERAKADGMCKKTVKTAKRELGIRTDKVGKGGWEWSLPKKPPAAP